MRIPSARATGYTLVELLLVLVLIGVAVGIGALGLRRFRDATALDRAGEVVRTRLAQARMRAIMDRGRVRLRLSADGALEMRDADELLLNRTPLTRGGIRVDSVRLRPSTFSFNSRGQAAPGSIYLYRDGRGIRVVCNFLGRTRVERFALP